jgi:hypothetical protein
LVRNPKGPQGAEEEVVKSVAIQVAQGSKMSYLCQQCLWSSPENSNPFRVLDAMASRQISPPIDYGQVVAALGIGRRAHDRNIVVTVGVEIADTAGNLERVVSRPMRLEDNAAFAEVRGIDYLGLAAGEPNCQKN